MIPFSPEHAVTLKVGDQFETDGVFPGVVGDTTVWKVVTITGNSAQVMFHLEARYCGIYLGSFTFYKGKLEGEHDSFHDRNGRKAR
jgi:hypothetical protein